MQRFDHGGVVQLVLGIRKQDPRSLPTKQEVAVVLDPLTAALRAGDVECVVPRGVQEDPATHGDTIQAHKWVKLVWNAAFNPVSAFAGGMTTRTILQDPQLRQVVRSAMDEVHAVGQADIGGPLPPSVRPSAPEEMIAFTESRGSVTPSMMVDLQQKRPMEREALLGNAVAAGARLGVPTPVLHTLYALLTAIERTYSS
ncbi:hypothetical protein GQ42DRAFT_55586 [Ramicandelaber brevisporus]|nr:hypothetical protein GQ42DRAFT_55586 [Ramicandelaber brevisporus]